MTQLMDTDIPVEALNGRNGGIDPQYFCKQCHNCQRMRDSNRTCWAPVGGADSGGPSTDS